MRPDQGPPTEALLDGRYQLGECIGEGGMARVHRGYDHALERPVAIKVMRAGVESASGLSRARGEMVVLASLSHPSLVTLYDARVIAGETSYLVMELVDGPTLSVWLDSGALSERDAALLGLDLAEALHVVHAAGIVHRDVKPSNVLLSPTDLPGRTYRARLADFGIAYLVDSTRLTSPGTVVGTAAYLAPEQVKGAPPAPPADIYALGLLLLEAMTGERAFAPAAGVESLVSRLHVAPTVPDSLGPHWQKLLVAMTSIDPALRPTALEVASTVSELLGTARREPLAATVVMGGLGSAGPQAADVDMAAADATSSATTPLHAPDAAGGALPPSSTAPTPSGAPAARTRRRPRRRRGMLIGVGLVAASAVAGGLWLAGNGAGVPAPAESVTAVTEPSLVPSEPVPAVEPVDVPAPVEETVVVPDQVTTPPQTDDDSATPTDDDGGDRAAQEAARVAEQVQKDAEKAAEQMKREAEKAAREDEKADRKGE